MEPGITQPGIPFTGTIADVPGIAVGHWTDTAAATGCTVVLCHAPPGNTHPDTDAGAVAGVSVRGGSPGTRETDLLNPIRRVERIHAILLSGGSAFGIAAADGVQRWLEERSIGFPTRHARIPIVPAAILYDLGIGASDVRPDAAAGYAAAASAASAGSAAAADYPAPTDYSATERPLTTGSVGAGAGATVAKMWGADSAVKGGFGSARCILPDGISVAAAVAVNAWGGIRDYRNGQLIAGPRRPDDGAMSDPIAAALTANPARGREPGATEPGATEPGATKPGAAELASPAPQNTTIGIVATDAPLDKMQANFVAATAHDGLALTIRPCHTPADGDTMFCIATGRHPGPFAPTAVGVTTVNLTAIVTAAVETTARAVLDAIHSATGLAGVPSVSELALDGSVSNWAV